MLLVFIVRCFHWFNFRMVCRIAKISLFHLKIRMSYLRNISMFMSKSGEMAQLHFFAVKLYFYQVRNKTFPYYAFASFMYKLLIMFPFCFQVCEELGCQEDVFPLAMSYLDRFLSVRQVRRSVFQLVGTTCLLIASKIRETTPISAERLVYYTANSFKVEDVWVSCHSNP